MASNIKMRFSLQTLVFLTLIAALIINYYLIVTRTSRSSENLRKESKQLEISRYTIENLQSWQGDPVEILEASRRQQQELIHARSKLVSAFESFATQAGSLDINESRFSIKQVPHFSEANRFVRSFNIFVPESMHLAAVVNCYEQPAVEGANRFTSADDLTVELPAGPSRLTFRFEKCDDHEAGSFDNVVTLMLDGEIRGSWVIDGTNSWYGIRASSTSLREQKDLTELAKLKLITGFEPSRADHGMELSIVDLAGSRNE